MLRPMSFRSDFFRLAVLWAHGGLYVDDKMLLTVPLSECIDLENDKIVLPRDPPLPMPRNPFDTFMGKYFKKQINGSN